MLRTDWIDIFNKDICDIGLRPTEKRFIKDTQARYVFRFKWPSSVRVSAKSKEAEEKEWELLTILRANGFPEDVRIERYGKPGIPGWYFEVKVPRYMLDCMIEHRNEKALINA